MMSTNSALSLHVKAHAAAVRLELQDECTLVEEISVDRLKLLQDMSTQFNLGLVTNFINDGSKIALVQVDNYVRNAVRNPSGNGYIQFPNQFYGCLDSAPLPTCNDNTLRPDPTTGQVDAAHFLWADATHLGSVIQGQIGTAAARQAHSNPF